MNNRGPGIKVLINDCNKIIVTEEVKQEALKQFKEKYNEPKEVQSIYISEEVSKHLEEYYLEWRKHEKQLKEYWENKLNNRDDNNK